jgi:hypothetical protein
MNNPHCKRLKWEITNAGLSIAMFDDRSVTYQRVLIPGHGPTLLLLEMINALLCR